MLHKNVRTFHVDMPFYELLIEIIEGKSKTNILLYSRHALNAKKNFAVSIALLF